jgi:Gpi18-like mannosyltransferase
MLLPGENYIHISCFEAQHELRIVDLSMMDREQLLDLVSKHYMVKAEPEVGDAQEAFLESKYATKAVSSVNPPLLYPIYRGVFEILGTSMSSIALLELFAFSLVFMMLSLIVAEAQPSLRLGPSMIAMAALTNYVIAITMLPVLHSAGGVFLLLFLAASWFLWRRHFVPAAGAFILMCLIRYEGVVLASLSLFAFLALADYQIRIRKYLLPTLAAAGVMCFFVVSIWSVELFQSEALVERMHMLTLTDISVQRVLDYMQWALILACGMPIFWILIKKTDRLSIYYLLIAVLYFGFLCSLNYIRPYHLGPFALAATAAGTRAIMGIGDAAIRKMIKIGFFVLALGSLYLVLYHLPRQVPVPLP